MKTFLRLAAAVAAFALVGCAFNRPVIREHTTEQKVTYVPATTNSPAMLFTNTVATDREASAKTFALWPATSELGKQRLTAGKTLSIGTEGLEEHAGLGTNDTQALRDIRAILGK